MAIYTGNLDHGVVHLVGLSASLRCGYPPYYLVLQVPTKTILIIITIIIIIIITIIIIIIIIIIITTTIATIATTATTLYAGLVLSTIVISWVLSVLDERWR
jgi:hypothetical protein